MGQSENVGNHMARKALIYGAVVFGAIWFVGWSTGMGGSFLPNLVFSLLMGALAAGCYWLIAKNAGKR